MIVMLSPGANSVVVNDGRGPMMVFSKDTKMEVQFERVQHLIEQNVLVKTEYPEIRNNEVAAVPWAGFE